MEEEAGESSDFGEVGDNGSDVTVVGVFITLFPCIALIVRAVCNISDDRLTPAENPATGAAII